MASPDLNLRVAILGASGIGEVHARIMHSLGVQVVGILGSTNSSAELIAEKLNSKYGFSPAPYSDLEALLVNEKPEAISICTPPEHHFLQLKSAFERNLPVFCEKPLLWEENITSAKLESQLDELKNYPEAILLVNTSNSTFLDSIKDEIDQTIPCKSFYFKFHTQGPYQKREIAVDLLPHGLSFLIKLLGSCETSSFSEEYNIHNYKCQFTYGICKVVFDFQENPIGDKALSFAINGRSFSRIQQGQGASYSVFLKDHLDGKKIKVEDPFQIYISKFLDICKNLKTKDKDEFDNATLNLKLMAEIILKK
jgi:hypothetical protein